MSMYAIQDTTLTALGDAVRKQAGKYIGVEEKGEPFYIGEFIPAEMDFDKEAYSQTYLTKTINLKELLGDKYEYTKYLYFESEYTAESAGVVRYFTLEKGGGVGLKSFITTDSPYAEENKSDFISYSTPVDTSFVCVVMYSSNLNKSVKLKLKLWACDANKKYLGLNKYTPLEMAEKIDGLMTIPDEAFNVSGNCQYKFAYGNGWIVKLYGEKITTKDISSINNMFSGSSVEIIPFEINCSSTQVEVPYFMSSSKVKQLPKMNIPKIGPLTNIFSGAYHLREIPDDNWNVGTYSGHTGTYDSHASIFSGCYSLRYITPKLMSNIWNKADGYYYSFYNTGFNNCYVLDEIVNLPVAQGKYTSNAFSMTFSYCARVKNIIFETNEDGTAKTAPWKSQTIDLSNNTGYHSIPSNITTYNSGITADKQVIDDATYQALKNDPDWYTGDINYSRYNHDSAVNTINSLPDCSATGTNTIKFKGQAGALTDGGAINTLTEAEIAVAVSKGWTVSLV